LNIFPSFSGLWPGLPKLSNKARAGAKIAVFGQCWHAVAAMDVVAQNVVVAINDEYSILPKNPNL
jgi:hypothetical protein